MKAISTLNLCGLPSINDLKKLLKSLAVLDAILSPEWEYRYYSFDTFWFETEEMASMRNGQGDDFHVWFSDGNCFIKGFDHESDMSPWNSDKNTIWPGVIDEVPKEFDVATGEPAFSMENTTFCIWRRSTDDSWKRGDIDFPNSDDPDGSEYLLELLDGNPESYQKFAKEYYETDIPLDSIASVYGHLPITHQILVSLNPDLVLTDISNNLKQAGYPDEATK